MTNSAAWKLTVLMEQEGLRRKQRSLCDFIDNRDFFNLVNYEVRCLMVDQLEAMDKYARILQARIDLWSKKDEPKGLHEAGPETKVSDDESSDADSTS